MAFKNQKNPLLATQHNAEERNPQTLNTSSLASLPRSINRAQIGNVNEDTDELGTNQGEVSVWLHDMSKRLIKKMPSEEERINFLKVVHFEAKRVSLDAQLVLALIETASDFKKYSVSQSGARGYMQVHPDWVALTGSPGDNLFHLRTNIRYGCAILKQNFEDEKGDLTKTLVRFHNAMNRHYGDQIDSRPTDIEFANRVLDTWKSNWSSPTGVSR